MIWYDLVCTAVWFMLLTAKSDWCQTLILGLIHQADRFLIVRSTKIMGTVSPVNTLRPRKDGRHFTDDIFKSNFVTEDMWIALDVSLKFIPKGSINNIPALVQIMAWCRPGDKPLSEPMMVSLLTHICITRPQWVKICVLLRHLKGVGIWATLLLRCL